MLLQIVAHSHDEVSQENWIKEIHFPQQHTEIVVSKIDIKSFLIHSTGEILIFLATAKKHTNDKRIYVLIEIVEINLP